MRPQSPPNVASTPSAVLRAGTAALLVAAASLGCGAPSQIRYERSVEQTPVAAVHAVHNARLTELMRGLERLANERLPKAMDPGIEEQRSADEIARVARSMARSAEQIPGAASEAALDDVSRAELLRFADTLQRRATVLADDADTASLEALRAQASAIEAACDQCHRRLLIPRGADESR